MSDPKTIEKQLKAMVSGLKNIKWKWLAQKKLLYSMVPLRSLQSSTVYTYVHVMSYSIIQRESDVSFRNQLTYIFDTSVVCKSCNSRLLCSFKVTAESQKELCQIARVNFLCGNSKLKCQILWKLSKNNNKTPLFW